MNNQPSFWPRAIGRVDQSDRTPSEKNNIHSRVGVWATMRDLAGRGVRPWEIDETDADLGGWQKWMGRRFVRIQVKTSLVFAFKSSAGNNNAREDSTFDRYEVEVFSFVHPMHCFPWPYYMAREAMPKHQEYFNLSAEHYSRAKCDNSFEELIRRGIFK